MSHTRNRGDFTTQLSILDHSVLGKLPLFGLQNDLLDGVWQIIIECFRTI